MIVPALVIFRNVPEVSVSGLLKVKIPVVTDIISFAAVVLLPKVTFPVTENEPLVTMT